MKRRIGSRSAAMRSAVPAVLAVMMVTTSCATGSTFRSGVGDTYLEHAPWVAGRAVMGDGAIAHVPIGYQRGATQPITFDPADGPDSAVGRLLAEMNTFLEGLGTTVRVAAPVPPGTTPPDVMFGCEPAAGMDCDEPGRPVRHRLAVARPSSSWIEWAGSAAADAGAERVLVITLETGNYWPRQRNLLGSKVVELGAGHTVDVPWLTSLDDPVSVLQLTGALVGPDGRAIRIGAEGLIARRTNLLLSAVGAQTLIRDEDVESVLTARRDDLPGRPLVWQAALRNLVDQLTRGTQNADR